MASVKYYGKQIVRDEFGEVESVYPPMAIISHKDAECDTCKAVLEHMGISNDRYDAFGDGDDLNHIDVYVSDKDEYNEFMEDWKTAKKAIAKGVK